MRATPAGCCRAHAVRAAATVCFLIAPFACSFSALVSNKKVGPALLEKLKLQPILGLQPIHGATRSIPSLEWCEDHVESIPVTTSENRQQEQQHEGEEPKLTLFDKTSQVHVLQKAWSREICQGIIECAEEHDHWSTGRHHLYPTTDVPVKDLPLPTKDACLGLAQEVLLPGLARIFDTPTEHLNFKDMFVAKYTPTGQPGLGEHTDGSAFSFNLLLSEPSDFEGGGTSFQTIGLVQPSQGDALLHRGSLLHQGNPVTRGCRYILVGFVDSDPQFVNTHQASALGSEFLTVTIPTFPLGAVLEVDEGDEQNSAVKVISCDEQQGSAFPAGLRSGDCIRGAILRGDDDDFSFEAWDGKTFDDVMARLVALQLRPDPLELVLERWCKGEGGQHIATQHKHNTA